MFQSIIEITDIQELKQLFKVEPDVYFDSHFRFDVPASKVQKKIIGDSSIDILLINVIISLLFTYAKRIGNESLQSRSIGFLQAIKPEKKYNYKEVA